MIGRQQSCAQAIAARSGGTAATIRTAATLGLLFLGALRPEAAAQEFPSPEFPAGLDLFVPLPPDARLDPALVELGKQLFHDPVLSRDSLLACVSCHQPARSFADGRSVAVGVGGRPGLRNVPALLNRAYGTSFFWDGRARTLEEAVLQPIVSRDELDQPVVATTARLSRIPRYEREFIAVFGRAPHADDLARALAGYVRSIRSADAPFDRFNDGDRSALGDLERLGLELFQGRARCIRCHLGPLLSDERFHNTGVAWRDGRLVDPGRAAITGRPEDSGAFKTPGLRNVEHTAPYMHDGSLATLEEVVEFYSRGGNPNPHLDPLLQALTLTEYEKTALVAFLRSLSGEIRDGAHGLVRSGGR